MPAAGMTGLEAEHKLQLFYNTRGIPLEDKNASTYLCASYISSDIHDEIYSVFNESWLEDTITGKGVLPFEIS